MGSAAKREKTTKSGFDLTTELLRGGLSEFVLNANTKLVLLYLAACYNVKRGKVFPKIKTIADSVGISEIGAKRAIAELLNTGLILKAKKGDNRNEYVITNKVLKYQNDTLEKQDDTFEGIKMILPCHEVKKEEIKKQQLKKEVAAVEKIPDIIRKNKDIKNPAAYWRSLDGNAKQGYIDKENEIKRNRERSARARAEQKAYFDKLEEIKKEPPFYTLFTKEEAQKYIDKVKAIDSINFQESSIIKFLINKFEFVL